MTKVLVFPSSESLISSINDDVDGYIIGINNLSVNCPFNVDVEDISQIIDNNIKKDIFISLNKNIFNEDLNYLEEVLNKISKLKVAGIFYYDVSVLQLVKKLDIKIPLVWAQEHLTTNYLTCNYYYDKGVKYAYLSSEITLNEVIEISEKSKISVIVPLFGYLPMFNSKRHIVKNYLDTFSLNSDEKIFYMEKENNYYPIVDDVIGTTVYGSNILNGLSDFDKLCEKNISYITLNSFNIDENTFKKVLIFFKNKDYSKIDELFKNTDKGFLYKETIYKVKKDGKKDN